MEIQSNAAFLPLSQLPTSKPNDHRLELEEAQILCSVVYRAVYGVNLSASIHQDEGAIKRDGRYTEQLDLLKKLIFEENWKVHRIFCIEEFRMVYQKIFSDKLNESHLVPFNPSELFERFLSHFQAEVQAENCMGGDLDVERSKRHLRDLYEEVSNVKGKLEALQHKLRELMETSKQFAMKGKPVEESQEAYEKTQSLQSTDAESTMKSSKRSSESSAIGSKALTRGNNDAIFHSDDEGNDNEDMEIENTDFPKASSSTGEIHENESDCPPKKTKPLLKKSVTNILKKWFLDNIEHPYPSKDTKEELRKLTGLSKNQLQNWFTNTRKRFLYPLKKKLEQVVPDYHTSMPDSPKKNLELQLQQNLPLKTKKSEESSQFPNQPQAFADNMQMPQQSNPQPIHIQQASPVSQSQMRIVQNNSLFVQGQQLPTGIIPVPGVQQTYPATLPMMNAPLIQQPYYQPPMQLIPFGPTPQQMHSHIGSMRPIQQVQAPAIQPIPQFGQTMPFLVTPTYMVVDPKVLSGQPLACPQINTPNFLPMHPTMTSGMHPGLGPNHFSSLNASSFNTSYPKTNIAIQSDLPFDFAYGYKKLHKEHATISYR